MTYNLYVGIDIAAASASIAVSRRAGVIEETFNIKQNEAGFAKLQERLREQASDPTSVLVVMEATGTYWMRLALTLYRAGYGVSVINPSQAHYFARALLKRGKTDVLDAQTLAHLAAAFEPKTWHAPAAVYEEVLQRLVQRDEVVEMLTQVRNQHHAVQKRGHVVAAVLERQTALMAFLEQQLADLEAEILAVFETDADWAQAAARLQTIPGIGWVTASWLLVATQNFSVSGTPEALAAYAGLVPVPHESGTSVRGRGGIGHRGHKRLRTALYLAALSAVRYNPVIRPFYQRLLERGKLKQVALCAAARKLLHLAWAVATKGCDFNPDYARRSKQVTAPS
jgi:transposase